MLEWLSLTVPPPRAPCFPSFCFITAIIAAGMASKLGKDDAMKGLNDDREAVLCPALASAYLRDDNCAFGTYARTHPHVYSVRIH